MPKYNYLVITTKSNLSETEHTRILNNYGLQGYRLLHQKNGIFGRVTYTLERASEAPKGVDVQRSPVANIGSNELLIVPSKHIYEVTEVLVKGLEAYKEPLPLEVKKLLTEWISLNRYDKLREEWEVSEE